MDEKFARLVEERFFQMMVMNPVLASGLGLRQFDHLLPDGTKAAHESWIRFHRRYLEELEAYPVENLSFDQEIDRLCLLQYLRLYLYELEELAFFRSRPRGPQELANGIYVLFSRESAPLSERLEAITSRLKQAPRFLKETQELLEDPVNLWVESEIHTSRRIPFLLADIIAAAKAARVSHDLISRLREAAEGARDAAYEHAMWLKGKIHPLARNKIAIGPERLERLIHLREFGLPAEDILNIGEEYLAQARESRRETADHIYPAMDCAEVWEYIRGHHPQTFEQVLEFCHKTLDEARNFVLQSGFASIPEGESLVVKETPPFMRHIMPLAAYIPPGKFEVPQRGLCLLTRPEVPELMKEFNCASLTNRAIHEGYPGHHLQLVAANQHPSPARALSTGIEFCEGWALYCEEMTARRGFHEEPEIIFIRETEMIRRACRIIVDIRLSSGLVSFEEAVGFLMQEAALSKTQAMTEVTICTFSPGYQLSYLLGKHLILQMRSALEESLKDGFCEKTFHDLLLGAGNLPMNLMKRVAFHYLEEKK